MPAENDAEADTFSTDLSSSTVSRLNMLKLVFCAAGEVRMRSFFTHHPRGSMRSVSNPLPRSVPSPMLASEVGISSSEMRLGALVSTDPAAETSTPNAASSPYVSRLSPPSTTGGAESPPHARCLQVWSSRSQNDSTHASGSGSDVGAQSAFVLHS